jgi:hypothetical protein
MSSTPFSLWIRTSESILRYRSLAEEMELVTQLPLPKRNGWLKTGSPASNFFAAALSPA